MVGSIIFSVAVHMPRIQNLSRGLTIYFNGYSPKAIYTADVFLVFTYLCCLYYFLGTLKTYLQFALLACFLSIPFATMSVVEFRPDLAWAVLLGFAVIFLVTRRDFFQTLMPSVVFGFFISFALLTKPSTFIMTLLLSGLAFSARLALEFFQPKRPAIRDIAKRTCSRVLAIMGTVGLITGPYIYYFGRDTWEYFWDNTFGKNGDIWVYKGGDTWTFYIYGGAFECNIYRNGSLLILAAIITLIIYRKRIHLYDFIELLGCLGLIGVAYVVNSTAPVKSPFLGGAFYGTLLFTMASIFGRYLSSSETLQKGLAYQPSTEDKTPSPAKGRNSMQFRYCFVTVLLVLCIVTYHWPSYSHINPADGRYMRNIHEKLYDYFIHTPSPARICLTQANPVVREDISICYMLRHQNPDIASAALAHSFEESWGIIITSDLVITQNSNFKDATGWLPCEKWQDMIVNRLLGDPDYHLELTYPDNAGKSLYVFRRTAKAATP